MKRKLLSLALTFALALTLLPTALAAEEPPTTELPKLATPTNLEWGTFYSRYSDGGVLSSEVPGSISFTIEGTHQRRCDIYVYNVDDPNTPVARQTDEVVKEGTNSSLPFILKSLPDGTYYFTVQNKGDGVNYADSDIAKSGEWSYTRGQYKLNKMDAPTWIEDSAQWENGTPTYTWTPLNDQYVGGYQIELYFSQDGTSVLSGEMTTVAFYGYPNHPNLSKFDLDEEDLRLFGPGYYCVRIRALGIDITDCYHSDWSELSAPYNVKDVSTTVGDQLDAIEENATAEEIRAAVQQIEDLKTALAADQGGTDGIAAKLNALETKTGVTTGVAVDSALAETFDQSKVSIVGAALNNLAENATQVTLNVGSVTDTDLVIPTLYNDTIATKFSMDVEGIANTEQLAVPVKITLPIPKNINPAFLVILHYHADGEPEVINSRYVYKEGGIYYASFILDRFSDFVMTQERVELTEAMFTVDTADATYTGSAITKTVTGKDGNTALVENTDYTVTYENNTTVGTATITVTGMGNYSGTLTYTFTIKSSSGSSGGNTSDGESSSSSNSSAPSKPTAAVGGDGKGGKVETGKGTVTITPDEGYQIEKVTVNGKEVEIPQGGKLTGLKSTDKVEVTFGLIPAPTPTPASELYPDVVAGSWYEDAVTFVVGKGLFQGTDKGVFAPEDTMTRAMLWTVLARMESVEPANAESWYGGALKWAVETGISDGSNPEHPITREQLVTMLYRYAGAPAAAGNLAAFPDGGSVASYAQAAMEWAVKSGIINGKWNGTLDPQGQATRAEVAAMLERFLKKG